MKDKVATKADFIYHSKLVKGERRHTVVGVVKDDELHIGHAIAGDRDPFLRKRGVVIASGRANKCPLVKFKVEGMDGSTVGKAFNEYCKKFPKEYMYWVLPRHMQK